MKTVPRALLVALLLPLGLALSGCEEGGGPGSVLPDEVTGPAGQRVEVAGVGDGDAVPCQTAGDAWDFSIGFVAENLTGPGTAQLLVEIDKDTSGEDVWGSNRGPYEQAGSVSVGPGRPTGTLRGRLGPPASAKVRFNVAVRLLDGQGQVVAVSRGVSGLKPTL